MDSTDKANIDIILRQTSYSREEATKLYLNYQKNTEMVIKKFLDIDVVNKNQEVLSKNQERMKMFRSLLKTDRDLSTSQ